MASRTSSTRSPPPSGGADDGPNADAGGLSRSCGVLLAHGADSGAGAAEPAACPAEARPGACDESRAASTASAGSRQQGAVAEQPPSPASPGRAARDGAGRRVDPQRRHHLELHRHRDRRLRRRRQQPAAERRVRPTTMSSSCWKVRRPGSWRGARATSAGIWINTQSITFESVPSYYAIASTRPLDEMADRDPAARERHRLRAGAHDADPRLGDRAVDRRSCRVQERGHPAEAEGRALRAGAVRRRLHRAQPVPQPRSSCRPTCRWDRWSRASICCARVGCCQTYTARVNLERQGLERVLHSFAFDQPLLYGLFTVAVAVGAGLLASTMFRRTSH